MIANDHELQVTLERIARFQAQVAHLRTVEANAANYHATASGFFAEIDRMQLEVREYLSLHPTALDTGAALPKESPYARRGQRARTRSRSTRRPRRYRRDTASLSGGMPLHWPSCADGAGPPQPAPGCRHPGCGHAERCRQTRCAVWCNLACGLLLLRWLTRVPSASSPTVGCGGGSLHKYHRTGADAQ
jgi:hypothetical protein